jgi:hypothetical protein
MAKKKAVRKSKKKPARPKKPAPRKKKKSIRKKSSAGRVAVVEAFEVGVIGRAENAAEAGDGEGATDEEAPDDDFPPDYGGSE